MELPKATDLLKQSWEIFKQKIKILIQIQLVPFVVAIPLLVIGLLAVSELIRSMRQVYEWRAKMVNVSTAFPPLSVIRRCLPAIGIGTVVGSIVGILPGASADAAAFLSYQQAKSRSALIREACAKYIAAAEKEERIRQYVEGYRRMPETQDELDFAESSAGALAELLADDAWNEE